MSSGIDPLTVGKKTVVVHHQQRQRSALWILGVGALLTFGPATIVAIAWREELVFAPARFVEEWLKVGAGGVIVALVVRYLVIAADKRAAENSRTEFLRSLADGWAMINRLADTIISATKRSDFHGVDSALKKIYQAISEQRKEAITFSASNKLGPELLQPVIVVLEQMNNCAITIWDRVIAGDWNGAIAASGELLELVAPSFRGGVASSDALDTPSERKDP